MGFLTAFNNCDLPAMEKAFAPDAACFDRVFMTSTGTPDIKLADYRRFDGMPPGMRRVAETLPNQPGATPPYQSITPRDLLIQMGADMAVCTFHLGGAEHTLGRRTIVMALRQGAWLILHIHASQVSDAAD